MNNKSINKTEIKKAIKNCQINIRKIEKHNNRVGSMFMVSAEGYIVAEQALQRILKNKEPIIPKIKYVKNVRMNAYNWIEEQEAHE